MNFRDLIQESSLLDAIEKLGWKTPMPIQEEIIPILRDGRNVKLQAKTGSGKTGAYLLPMLEQIDWEENQPFGLIIAPTRELAMQIKDEAEALGKFKRIKCVNLVGKQPMAYQVQDLKQKTHIVCGTPGRILDHLHQGTLPIERLRMIVLDEVDEICQMGFGQDIHDILDVCAKDVTMCVASATMSDEVEEVCSTYAAPYESISLSEDTAFNLQIKNEGYMVNETEKASFLWKLLVQKQPSSAIIFTNTRETCEYVYDCLHLEMKELSKLHGAMEQEDRMRELEAFRYGKTQFLISTDVAARGLDMEQVSLVINYDVPEAVERFLHRAGRSGRKQQAGHVISLITKYDRYRIQQIEERYHIQVAIEDRQGIDAQQTDSSAVQSMKDQRVIKEKKSAVLSEGVLRLYIYGGKKKKLRPGDLVGAICQIADVNAEDIGVIQVQEQGSYVEILHDKGMRVYKELQQRTIKNKRIKVEISHKQ